MSNSNQLQKSKLALAIEQRDRKVHEFDVQGFFGLGNKQVHKVGIRVNTKSDEDVSVVSAHRYTKQVSDGLETARNDMDLLNDSKAIEALFRACRGVDLDAEQERRNAYPAFPGPKWMRENLTTDQIATLLNLYHEVRRREAPTSWMITMKDILVYARASHEASETSLPDQFLAEKPQEWVVQAFIVLSKKFFDLVHKIGLEKFDDDFSLKEVDEDVHSADDEGEFDPSESVEPEGTDTS